MGLVDKLKEYNGNMTVDQLDKGLRNQVLKYAHNFAEESFVSLDEKEQVEAETLRSRLCDVIALMEDE